MLAIPIGLVVGNANDRPNAPSLAKDEVHLFQGSIRRFRIEEVDRWKNKCAVTVEHISYQSDVAFRLRDLHDSKNDVCLITDR